MIGSDSPLPPRIALVLACSILLSAVAAWWGLNRLGDERQRLAQVEAMAEAGARPRAPLMAHGLAFADADRGQAVARFKNRLTMAAAGHRLLLERIEALPVQQDRQALLIAEIAVSGSEADIRRFTAIIERSKPAIRFERWQVGRTADGDSTVRVEARALALWVAGT